MGEWLLRVAQIGTFTFGINAQDGEITDIDSEEND